MKAITLRAAVVAGVMLLGAALPAQADVISWNLSGVKFSDGASASGSIDMDATARTWSSFNVSTTAGVLGAFTFDNTNSGLYFGGGVGANNFILFTNDGRRYFNFSFDDALNPAGNSFALSTANSYECNNCGTFRRVTAGALSAQAADLPEPATTALLLPALGMLSWMSRRRKRQAAH